MKRDIFYKTDELSHSDQEKLLRKAYSLCSKWWLDKLDCKVSFARQQMEGVSFEETMRHFDKRAIMVVIHRQQMLGYEEKPYLEIGFRSMESPVDYFLWIIVDFFLILFTILIVYSFFNSRSCQCQYLTPMFYSFGQTFSLSSWHFFSNKETYELMGIPFYT